MDPITAVGAVASIITLAQTALSLSKALYTLGSAVQSASEDIEALADDLKTFAQSLNLLSRLLEDSKSWYSDDVYLLTAKIIKDCADLYEKIDKILVKLGGNGKNTWKIRMKFVYKEGQIRKLMKRLRDMKGNLATVLMSLQVDLQLSLLNISSSSKIQRSPEKELDSETIRHLKAAQNAVESCTFLPKYSSESDLTLNDENSLQAQVIDEPHRLKSFAPLNDTHSLIALSGSHEPSYTAAKLVCKSITGPLFAQLNPTNHEKADESEFRSLKSVSSTESFKSAVSVQKELLDLAHEVKAVKSVLHAFRTALDTLDNLIERRIPDRDACYPAALQLKVTLIDGQKQVQDTHLGYCKKFGIQYVKKWKDTNSVKLHDISIHMMRAVVTSLHMLSAEHEVLNAGGFEALWRVCEKCRGETVGVLYEVAYCNSSQPNITPSCPDYNIYTQKPRTPNANESMREGPEMSLPFIGYTFKRFETNYEPPVTAQAETPKPELLSPSTEGRQSSYECCGIIVEPENPTLPGPELKTQQLRLPGSFDDDDVDFAAYIAAGLKDNGFDPNSAIDDPSFRRRDSPPRSNKYGGPFAETVTDLDHTPSTSEISKSGFVLAGAEATPHDWHSVGDSMEGEEFLSKLSKKEQKKRNKARRHTSNTDEPQPTRVSDHSLNDSEAAYEHASHSTAPVETCAIVAAAVVVGEAYRGSGSEKRRRPGRGPNQDPIQEEADIAHSTAPIAGSDIGVTAQSGISGKDKSGDHHSPGEGIEMEDNNGYFEHTLPVSQVDMMNPEQSKPTPFNLEVTMFEDRDNNELVDCDSQTQGCEPGAVTKFMLSYPLHGASDTDVAYEINSDFYDSAQPLPPSEIRPYSGVGYELSSVVEAGEKEVGHVHAMGNSESSKSPSPTTQKRKSVNTRQNENNDGKERKKTPSSIKKPEEPPPALFYPLGDLPQVQIQEETPNSRNGESLKRRGRGGRGGFSGRRGGKAGSVASPSHEDLNESFLQQRESLVSKSGLQTDENADLWSTAYENMCSSKAMGYIILSIEMENLGIETLPNSRIAKELSKLVHDMPTILNYDPKFAEVLTTRDSIIAILKMVDQQLGFELALVGWSCVWKLLSNHEDLLSPENENPISILKNTYAQLLEITGLIARYAVMENLYRNSPTMTLKSEYKSSLYQLCLTMLFYFSSAFELRRAQLTETKTNGGMDEAVFNEVHKLGLEKQLEWKCETLLGEIRAADDLCRGFKVVVDVKEDSESEMSGEEGSDGSWERVGEEEGKSDVIAV